MIIAGKIFQLVLLYEVNYVCAWANRFVVPYISFRIASNMYESAGSGPTPFGVSPEIAASTAIASGIETKRAIAVSSASPDASSVHVLL